MLRYALMRLLAAVPTLLVVILITFTLTHISPYDPVRQMLSQVQTGNTDTEENIRRVRAQYGLDDPFLVQFGAFLSRLAHGNLGVSINGQRDVLRMIAVALPISGQLALAGAFLVAVIGIPLGALAALKQNTWVDYVIVSTTLVLRTLPVYVLAPLLLMVFVLGLHVMKVPRGWHGLFSWQSILPVILMTLGPLPIIVRQTRSSVLEILSQDYVRTARGKGLSIRMIIQRHVLRNALIPVVTSLGLLTEGLIVGTVFVDTIFGIPGYGGIAAAAFASSDYPVILGITLTSAVLVILTNAAVELFYPILDPRVKLN